MKCTCGHPEAYNYAIDNGLCDRCIMEELERLREECRWIPVGERLPETDECVLWCFESGGMVWESIDDDSDSTTIGGFLSGYNNTGRVTHWRKITLPKGD